MEEIKTPLGLCTELSYVSMRDEELIQLVSEGDKEALVMATTRGLLKRNSIPQAQPDQQDR